MTDDLPQDPFEGDLPPMPENWTDQEREFTADIARELERASLDLSVLLDERDIARLMVAVDAMDVIRVRATLVLLVKQLQNLGK